METPINFNEKKGFICDMDGVIYHGNRILPGVAEFIQWLHDEDKEYLFLTNNSGYTPRELNQKLARMGLDVPESRPMNCCTRRERTSRRISTGDLSHRSSCRRYGSFGKGRAVYTLSRFRLLRSSAGSL